MADLDSPEQGALAADARDENGIPVIRLSGDLDMTSVKHARAAIDATLSSHPSRVILDAGGLEYMDSSGIAGAPPGVRDAIAVMVGELAMNAVEHARTGFQVTAELTDGTVRVEVTDSGGNYPAARPMPPPTSARGRGLPIVDTLADDWGITPARHGPGKTIWFKVAVPGLAAHAPRAS